MSLSLLNAAGLEMCEPGTLDQDGTVGQENEAEDIDHDAYSAQQSALEIKDSMQSKIVCPFACQSANLSTDDDVHIHLKTGSDATLCPNLDKMVWEATTKDLLNNLSSLVGLGPPSVDSNMAARLDSNSRFHLFTTGLLYARSLLLDVDMFAIPQPIARYMWEWATTDRPDSQAVVNSFQNKLQHQPTVDVLKTMDSMFRPEKFFVPFNKGKHGKSEKNWRPLHEWMLDECLKAKYVFFKLEHPLRRAGDNVMVVLVVSKKVAICFDPKCMMLEGEERAKRDAEIYASVKRLLNVLTKKFQRNLLRDNRRKQWETYMEQPLAVYVYASPWLEQMVRVLPVDSNEFIFELLVLAFYYRCTMQETACYNDGGTDSIPVPTFFLEAVSDIGALLTDAVNEDGRPTATFWRELIEWALSRIAYDSLYVNDQNSRGAVSALLEQSYKMGKTPDIPARAQVARLEHEFRLVEPVVAEFLEDDMREPSPEQNSTQDSMDSSRAKEVQSLLKIDMVDDSVPVNHMVGERALRPVAARKAATSPTPLLYQGSTPPSSSSKRKTTVPSKNKSSAPTMSPQTEVPRPSSANVKRRKVESGLRQNSNGSVVDPYDFDGKSMVRTQNGPSNLLKRPTPGFGSHYNMPPSLPSSSSSRASAEHKYNSEILTKMIQPKSETDLYGNFQCQLCHGFSCSDLPGMKDHVREHLGLCPYECYHCHRGFSCIKTFRAHADVLGIPYFRCMLCQWLSDEENEMHRHLQDEHLELPKFRKEELFQTLKFYKPAMDLKGWGDYILSKEAKPSRVDHLLNGGSKKKEFA